MTLLVHWRIGLVHTQADKTCPLKTRMGIKTRTKIVFRFFLDFDTHSVSLIFGRNFTPVLVLFRFKLCFHTYNPGMYLLLHGRLRILSKQIAGFAIG